MTSARPAPAVGPAHPARPRPVPGPGLELSVWPTAQQDARTQRRGRYLPASTAHPAKMLPAIAAIAIARYTRPGDLVADPMCGIGTTLVEAIHLGRDAIGVEFEDRWAAIAASNISLARRQGAIGAAQVIGGDARQLPALLPPGTAGRAALVVTSPPYGPSVHGQVRAERRSGGGGVAKYDNRYSLDPANLAHQGMDDMLAGFTQILAGLHDAAAPRRRGRGHRPALAPPRRARRPARRRHRRRPRRGPDPGRPVRGPARRAARRPADPPALVLPARQHPQSPPPRPALAPDRPRRRPHLPRAASRRARPERASGRQLGSGGLRAGVTGSSASTSGDGRLAGPPVRIGSMCSGYGGLDLAAMTVLGARLAWCAETDPHASKVLAARFPGVPNLGDLTAVNWAAAPPADLVTAGFPCQDISAAGRGAGIREGTRSGLWISIARALGHLRPGYVLVENVAALRSRGLGRVLADLAALGYDTQWTSLRASDTGAPHRRDRLFILAWQPGTLPRLAAAAHAARHRHRDPRP